MNRLGRPRGYQGSYLIGFVFLGVVAFRVTLFYWDHGNLIIVIPLLAIYTLLYALEPWLSTHTSWYPFFYFPAQIALVVMLSYLRPFLDFQNILYLPLCMQAFRAFSRRAGLCLSIVLVILMSRSLIAGMGSWEAFAFLLVMLASGTFLISYDFLYLRAQADQAESQRLLGDLQSTHQKLQEQAAKAEELAAARERNRLARELHDSVSQVIFSITLTSQSARLLLERDPARVPEEMEHLQEMTSCALNQLRSLIAELRPPQNS